MRLPLRLLCHRAEDTVDDPIPAGPAAPATQPRAQRKPAEPPGGEEAGQQDGGGGQVAERKRYVPLPSSMSLLTFYFVLTRFRCRCQPDARDPARREPARRDPAPGHLQRASGDQPQSSKGGNRPRGEPAGDIQQAPPDGRGANQGGSPAGARQGAGGYGQDEGGYQEGDRGVEGRDCEEGQVD